MRVAISAALLFLVASSKPARAGTVILALSSQNIQATGLGPNASGNGQLSTTVGSCAFDGTNTSCMLSGTFTGLGPGGTYRFVTTYPGNGPSPVVWTTTTPGGNQITRNLNGGSETAIFNLNDGSTVSFLLPNYTVAFSFPATTCTGVSTCGPGPVGLTAGATISGPVTGTVSTTPQIRANQGVINAGAYGAFTSTAPSSWIEIFGSSLTVGTSGRLWAGVDFNGDNAPTALDGTSVTIGGQAAFVEYVSPGQVNAQVPSGVGTGFQPVVVSTMVGGSSLPYSINVNPMQPGLLTTPAFRISGIQYVAALFPDNVTFVLPPGAIADVASRRARPGDTIILYGVGFGPVTPNLAAGRIARQTADLSSPLQVTLGGVPAAVAYKGLAPNYVGLYQFNVVVPNVASSDSGRLVFTVAGQDVSQTVFLPVQN